MAGGNTSDHIIPVAYSLIGVKRNFEEILIDIKHIYAEF
jgi:hypothetical protein